LSATWLILGIEALKLLLGRAGHLGPV
jgi:hypothetical protein